MVDVADAVGPADRLHNLLLLMAGRIDDDAANSVRELVGLGQIDSAAEFLAGCLLAGRIPVTSTEQYHLRRVLDESRSLHSLADRLHVVDFVPIDEHRFSGQERGDAELVEALAPSAARLSGVRGLWCAWRTTPAGVNYGAVPRRVLLAEVGSDGSPAAVGYQLLAALRRAGIDCSVDVFGSGTDLPPYHRSALESARRVHLDMSVAVSHNANHGRAPRMSSGGDRASASGGKDLSGEPAGAGAERTASQQPVGRLALETSQVGIDRDHAWSEPARQDPRDPVTESASAATGPSDVDESGSDGRSPAEHGPSAAAESPTHRLRVDGPAASGAERSADASATRSHAVRPKQQASDEPVRSEQGSAEEGRAEQARAEQARAEQDRAEQSRVESKRAEQDRAERSEQSRAESERTEQDRTEQSRSEPNRTEQDRPEHAGADERETELSSDGSSMRVPAAVDAKLTDRERNLLRKLHEELAQREQDRAPGRGDGEPSRSGHETTAKTPMRGTGGFPTIGTGPDANHATGNQRT